MLKKYNFSLIILPLLIFSLGFITLMSTSILLVKSHLIYFFIGFVFYILFSMIDYRVYKYLWKYLYVLSLILLFITTYFANSILGSARWLQIGGLSFQTSEFAKLALIISLSSLIEKNILEVSKLHFLGKSFLILLPYTVLVYMQPDLGTTLVLIALFLGILFFAGLKKIYFLLGFIIFGLFSAPIWHMLKDYQKSRILVFLNPQMDVLGSGYNVIQSIIAIGSGGLFGKGFGRGTQANLQFLPAYWTDFIFASFAEEWGFFGVFILIILYCLLLLSLLYVVNKTKNIFGKFIVIGTFLVIFTQFVINVGMNMGLMPVTGVTLPLMSYGGTSILFTLILLGIVQNIWIKSAEISID